MCEQPGAATTLSRLREKSDASTVEPVGLTGVVGECRHAAVESAYLFVCAPRDFEYRLDCVERVGVGACVDTMGGTRD